MIAKERERFRVILSLYVRWQELKDTENKTPFQIAEMDLIRQTMENVR